jgi:sterol desaturase/sphingolipid hydroxylase (fatty acid hydroxylase superfamily)
MAELLDVARELVGWIVGDSLLPDHTFSFSQWLLLPATLIMVLVIGLEFLFPKEQRSWNRQHLLAATHFVLAAKVSLFTFVTAPAMQWLWIRFQLPSLHLDETLHPAAFMIVTLLVYSFIDYWAHRLLHRVPLLWHIHKIHHAPTQLAWASTFQEHFAMTITSAPMLTVSTLLLGTHLVPPWGSVYILVNYLQHANVSFRFGWLNYVFALPEIHRYHHERDPKYYDTNFSGGLMIWDHVFGTFVYDPNRPARDFGIDEAIPLSWAQQQWLPLTHIARDVRDSRLVRALTGRAAVDRIAGDV